MRSNKLSNSSRVIRECSLLNACGGRGQRNHSVLGEMKGVAGGVPKRFLALNTKSTLRTV